jgi:hypothetical protein
MCSSMTGASTIFSASISGTEVKLSPAGLITTPAAASIASCTQPTSSPSKFDWRNTSGWSPAAARHIPSISASVVRP